MFQTEDVEGIDRRTLFKFSNFLPTIVPLVTMCENMVEARQAKN